MGRLRWASAILATGLLLLIPNVSTAWAAAPDPATCALQYLASGQATSGAVGGQPGVTADFIFGAAAAGFDPTTLKKSGGSSAFDYLEAGIGGSLSNAALVAKEALAAIDGKLDPTAFGSTDLLTALDATYDSTTHRYGDGETYTQALALLALTAAADSSHPLPAAAVTELIGAQDTDGSWDFQGVKDAAGGGDTNSTAIAIQALVAAGTPTSDASITAALTYLHSQQLSDGGFPYNHAFPPAFSDPDSDANVIQGLLAAGEDPGGPAWTKSGHTALTNILTFQSPANGGFTYPGNPGPDAFTTSQVPAGIKEIPFPGSTSWTADRALPAGICAAAVSSGGGHPVATPPVTATVAAAAADPATTDTTWVLFLALAILGSLGISRRIWSRRPSR
ncbi:MAG TPA: hypothetical protein VKR24_07020 [Candidatus Limnocylindrales bacterium]|nr:hypothetical protein [Candidatus Limnocylindrales bacterium]